MPLTRSECAWYQEQQADLGIGDHVMETVHSVVCWSIRYQKRSCFLIRRTLVDRGQPLASAALPVFCATRGGGMRPESCSLRFGYFIEGFDTWAFEKAKALLDELA